MTDKRSGNMLAAGVVLFAIVAGASLFLPVVWARAFGVFIGLMFLVNGIRHWRNTRW